LEGQNRFRKVLKKQGWNFFRETLFYWSNLLHMSLKYSCETDSYRHEERNATDLFSDIIFARHQFIFFPSFYFDDCVFVNMGNWYALMLSCSTEQNKNRSELIYFSVGDRVASRNTCPLAVITSFALRKKRNVKIMNDINFKREGYNSHFLQDLILCNINYSRCRFILKK